MRILITAGGTREYIDPVRFISNASSGKTGFALAGAALKAGHKVTLITTIAEQRLKTQNSPLVLIKVETAAEMFKAVRKHFPQCDCLIMAAAVADYTPVRKSKIKIKKSKRDLMINLRPTADILKWAGQHKNSKLKAQNLKLRIVAGFALEDKNLRRNAEKKLREKNLDMIVANTADSIGSDKTDAQIKLPGCSWIRIGRADKMVLSKRIISLVEELSRADKRLICR